MKAMKLSFALACLLAFGAPSLARAQDNGAPSHGIGPVQVPASVEDNVSFNVQSAPLPGRAGSFSTFSFDSKTGAYTVITGGIQDHFEEIKSQGKLSASQLESLNKALATAKDATPPAKLPGAPVDGAPTFTLSWFGGGASGPNNPKAAVEGQPASVKALWKAVSPLLKSMQTLSDKLVKDDPYVPNVKTVEAAPTDATKAPKSTSVDLGHLAAPGTDFLKAAEAKGLVADGGLFLKPGEKVTFTTDRNQINGIASMESSNPDVTVTSKIVKSMVPGQLGDEQTVEWTIALSPQAGSATMAEVTAHGDYMSRNDPKYNFKVGVSAKPVAPTASETAAADGVDARIRNRGGDAQAPRTGMGQLIDERVNEAKDGAKAEDR